jgi:hypothetical protein
MTENSPLPDMKTKWGESVIMNRGVCLRATRARASSTRPCKK